VILDFKAQLDRAGIELIFVPVPPKAIIYPDAVSEQAMEGKNGPPRFDLHHQRFYTLLRKSGVKVLDLAPDFMARRRDKAGAVYCKQDTHWSGRACVLAAQQIARHVQDRPWRTSPPKAKLAQEWKTVTITGDLWEALGQTALPRETLPLRFVGERTSAGIKPVSPDRASPVLLLGDSHNLIFHSGDDMQARGAGLADQLALEFGFPVDLVAVRGSGATPARVALQRRARAVPNYLANKKLVIWCLSAREFTESAGWQKVPVSTSQAQ
jgi:alginate O-acetyltransferase complex protein AlgJ